MNAGGVIAWMPFTPCLRPKRGGFKLTEYGCKKVVSPIEFLANPVIAGVLKGSK